MEITEDRYLRYFKLAMNLYPMLKPAERNALIDKIGTTAPSVFDLIDLLTLELMTTVSRLIDSRNETAETQMEPDDSIFGKGPPIVFE